jgi:hypothetical protein
VAKRAARAVQRKLACRAQASATLQKEASTPAMSANGGGGGGTRVMIIGEGMHQAQPLQQHTCSGLHWTQAACQLLLGQPAAAATTISKTKPHLGLHTAPQ